MRLLAGRKNCRDFCMPDGVAGLPKSSLDGVRETVLQKGISDDVLRSLRLSTGEQLDVVALTKRQAAGRQSYPSVSRIAADPWLRGAAASPCYETFFQACKALAKNKILGEIDAERFPNYSNFPFEGTAVYRDRHPSLCEEARVEIAAFAGLREPLGRLIKDCGEPDPYLAILVADGDRIGAAIAAIESPEAHRAFSRQLAQFAAQAKNCIEQARGVLVYAGGDDVLAFVPVDQCLVCARKLHDEFSALLRLATPSNVAVSLSVGLAIGHMMEPLEDLRAYAYDSEKTAKLRHGR